MGHRNTQGISVVLPTYNERENLPRVLNRIDDVFETVARPYEAIVVDDDSPDGTWELAQSLCDRYPLRVIRRTTESGLASAVVTGFQAASYDSILVIDADLQHPPERIPALLNAMKSGHDIAIGSRFVEGGSTGQFSVVRLTIWKTANALAKILFPKLRGISDLQSGFFVFNRSVIRDANLSPVGYKILLEILVRGHYDSITEVGYRFREREEGDSAMGVGTILAYFHHLVRLKRDSIADRCMNFVHHAQRGGLI